MNSNMKYRVTHQKIMVFYYLIINKCNQLKIIFNTENFSFFFSYITENVYSRKSIVLSINYVPHI